MLDLKITQIINKDLVNVEEIAAVVYVSSVEAHIHCSTNDYVLVAVQEGLVLYKVFRKVNIDGEVDLELSLISSIR